MTSLLDVLHEVNSARIELRKSSSELNRATTASSRVVDVERLRTYGGRVVEQLDSLDLLFEMLRIELNPDGIAYSPRLDHNIHGICYRAIVHKSTQIKAKGLTYKLDNLAGFVVRAYPSLVVVPLVLIDNAIKYCVRGGHIEIRLDKESNTAVVTSPGPRIFDNELLNIFEMGVRGRNAERVQRAGQGRGLSIAKNVLDADGFSIAVRQKDEFLIGGVPYSNVSFTVHFGGDRAV